MTLYAGHVTKLRLLGDMHHMSRIAFVEFEEAESANQALDISGALLGMHFFSHWAEEFAFSRCARDTS